MLCLTRKINQRILIQLGDTQVWVHFVKYNTRDQAVIGVDAPKEVMILREELVAKEQPCPSSC